MVERKVAFIIPGFNETPDQPPYKQVARYYNSIGVEPIPVPINWKRSTILENTEQFLGTYHQTEATKKLGFGFSFGAMILLIAASKVSLSHLILSSISPYFKEDLDSIPWSWKVEKGHRRMDEFANLSFDRIVRRVNSPSIILVGEEEDKILKKRSEEAFLKLPEPKQLITITSAQHDLSHPNYLKIIGISIHSLNEINNINSSEQD